MSALELTLVVLGMAIVTYLPRMLPLVLLTELNMPPFLRRFLQFIPYAVLGSLIFPGVLYSTSSITASAIGAVAAVVLALLRTHLLVVVMGSIAAVYVSELLL
ncbi:AzlD domain-containing protein [Paenibacillus turpanensis]|uniref:AzlD domain-containing protein n=1 Tax=Paenibacillus turpanensis TaxID=2689078 RepID=UPI00140C962F|nr:AzlD domain-containing protein [Paenibacillus turpanensis]